MRFVSVFAALAMSLTASIASAEVIHANVSGMTCESCAQAIDAVVIANKNVRSVKINVEKGKVCIREKPARHVSDLDVMTMIKEAGYTTTRIWRTQQ